MKSYLYTLIAAAAATGLAVGATAYTTPVGYVTTEIKANTSASAGGAATFVAAPLVHPSVFTSSSTASPSGGTVIAFSGDVPAGLDSSYFLEINAGTQEGWWSAIIMSTSTSITIADQFPGSLPANVNVSVRKFTTIQDVFGDNAPGLAPFSNELPYDEIQFLDPVSQVSGLIVYLDGWFNLVTELPADDEIIYPGTSVQVINTGNTALSVVASGEVKTTQSQVDVFPGDNWLAQTNPVGATMGNMNLGTQLLEGTDVLSIFEEDTGAGQPTTPYVSFESEMYNLVMETLAEDVVIISAEGFVLTRPVGAPSTLIFPSPTIAP